MKRTVVMPVLALLLIGACTSSEPSSSYTLDVPSTTAQTTTSSAPPRVGPSSTTTSTIAPAALQPPPPVVIELLEPTGPVSPVLVWNRSTVEFDRDLRYWLGVVGDEFVLLSWDWPVAGLAVQRSPDGLSWSAPMPLEGVPATASPVEMWRWDKGISGSSVGMIGLFDTTPKDDRQAGHDVFTSPDGVEWTQETLPLVDHASEATGPFGVAASDDGYAVWVTADERRPQTDTPASFSR